MSGKIPLKDQKILCLRSGNRCAIPSCHVELVVNKTRSDANSIIGVMAHIKGEKKSSARYDSNQTDKQRNCYGNLILVCGNCHKVIDDQPNTYTVAHLLATKTNHENWIIESTKREVINVTFLELSVVTKYLVLGNFSQSDTYTIIAPKEKIKKNQLSSSTEQLITMGMTQVQQVSHFISKSPDTEFGERLKQGFVTEYEKLLHNEKLKGDDLFNSLLDFASSKSNDFKNKAAGLSVLVYLFEKCEVFEK